MLYTVVGICHSISSVFMPSLLPPRRHTLTHTQSPALMHFYCPHPLFLRSSSLLPPVTTTSLSSATRPASPSLICPRASILSHSVSLSLLLTQSFSSPPHPSLSLTSQLAPVYTYVALSTCRSPLEIVSRRFASYPMRKRKQT